ncbi:MAG TPA: universal stress protein [Solirubrobacter sp.]|nr:universal stress protein [Solirubrobacter sp.]
MRLAIAYDGSSSAAAALQAAARLFPGAHATVLNAPRTAAARAGMAGIAGPTLSPELIQATLDEIDAESQAEAQAVAGEGVERATALGLDASAGTVEPRSPLWEALLAAAHAAEADVLVCGTRGRGGLARALLGSTSTSLLHNTDLPLLVVHEGDPATDGPALLAFDGSDGAKRAIEAAGRVLGERPVIVVHAWESQYRRTLTAHALARGPVDDIREIVDTLEQALSDDATAVMHDGVAAARAAGLTAIGETRESDDGAWRTLVRAAAEHDAALVVTGSRGIGGARSALLGSVSSGLIHNAERPVLVVPS